MDPKDQQKPKNILIISFAWSQKDKGGLGQHVLELTQELSKNAYQVTVFCIDTRAGKKPYQTTSWQQGPIEIIETTYCHHDVHTLHDMQAPHVITKLIKEKTQQIKPDIIHIHHCLYVGFQLFKELASIAPIIHTLHDYYAITPRGQILDKNHRGVKVLQQDEWVRQVQTTWPELSKNSQIIHAQASKQQSHDSASLAHYLMRQWIDFNASCLKQCSSLICPSSAAAEIFHSSSIDLPLP